MKITINLLTLKCKRCGHEWIPRVEKPVTCPNPRCRSPYWDKKKKVAKIDHRKVQKRICQGKATRKEIIDAIHDIPRKSS